MFGLRRSALGLTLALASSSAFAQTTVTSASIPTQPAARLGRIIPIENPEPGLMPQGETRIVPVQATPTIPGVGMPTTLVQGPMGGTGGTLPQPRPVGGPKVTETRDPGALGGTLVPSVPYVQGDPGFGGAYPTPILSGTPGVPLYEGETPGFAPETGFGTPVLMDPYLGPGTGLFPRVRNAVIGGGTPFGGRLSIEADYLMWFVKAQGSPTLVTTSSPQFNGILGQGDTRILFGADDVLGNTRHSGFRIAPVFWFSGCRLGLEGSFFFLGRNSGNFVVDSNTDPLIARPFTRADTGAQFSELVAFPGLARGSVAANFSTEMYGTEANVRFPLLCGACSRLDGFVGFRHLNLAESLDITEQFTRTAAATANTDIARGVVQDQFRTENRFYGVNFGFTGEKRWNRWFASFRAAVALGTVYQSLEVAGAQTLTTVGGVTSQTSGGLYALPGANIGMFTQSKFGVVPEGNVTMGYYLTKNLRLGVGFNFLYINSVLRPSGQIDQTLDVTRIPNFPVAGATAVNPARPRPPMKTTDIYTTGITFSLTWTW